MRKFNLFMLIAIGFVFAACAHQSVSEQQRRPAGIDQSVLPVFVIGYDTSSHKQLSRGGAKTVTTANFKACSAVYVAPHLLATSVSAFPREQNGVTMYDPGSVVVLHGTTWLSVSDVPFFDPETGLVLIRTDQVGVPLMLRDGPLDSTEILKRVGYTFRLAPSGILGIPSWDVGPAVVDDTINSLSVTTQFSVQTELHRGNCGAPLIDDEGRLVGIIHQRISKNEAVVIGPALIAQALREVQ